MKKLFILLILLFIMCSCDTVEYGTPVIRYVEIRPYYQLYDYYYYRPHYRHYLIHPRVHKRPHRR